MPSLTTLAVVAGIAAVLYGLGRVVLSIIKSSGAVEVERDEARRDREDARKQAEIMLQQKDEEDAARDLDSGDY